MGYPGRVLEQGVAALFLLFFCFGRGGGQTLFSASEKGSMYFLWFQNMGQGLSQVQVLGFDVNSNPGQNSPCLPNSNSSANQVRVKRFSQTCRLKNWLYGCQFSKEVNNLVVNGADFCQATYLSGFDVKSNSRKLAAICQIFILQQIKLKKNGFYRLLD